MFTHSPLFDPPIGHGHCSPRILCFFGTRQAIACPQCRTAVVKDSLHEIFHEFKESSLNPESEPQADAEI